MKRFFLAMIAFQAHFAALRAADYTWVGGSTPTGTHSEWSTPANYTVNGQTATTAPGRSDVIKLTTGTHVYVDDATVDFFKTVGAVNMPGEDIVVTINVANDSDFDCPIGDLFRDGKYTNNVVVKEGAGKLTFTGSHTNFTKGAYNLNTGFHVKEGAIDLGRSWGQNINHTFKGLVVDTGATLYCMTNGSMYFKGLSGGGTIVGRNPSGCRSHFLVKPDSITSLHVEDTKPAVVLPTDDRPTVFSGKITGSFAYFTAYGSTYFTGTESDFTAAETRLYGRNATRPYAECGFMTLGPGGQASSLGTASTFNITTCSLYLRYLGTTGETTDRGFTISDTSSHPMTIDGGAAGGLVLTGTLSSQDSTHYQQRLTFAGTNAVAECVSSNKFLRIASDGDAKCSFFVRKSGPGTWHFLDRSDDSQLSGVVGVDEGTLAFDTLRSQGLQSSLGDARDLYEDKAGPVSTLATVPYALFAGGTDSEAVFSYVGTTPLYVEDRPLAVSGLARFKAANCEAVKWHGVRGLGSGEKKLTIECAAAQTNTFAGISDSSVTGGGEGTLSIVKDGAGDLVLSGNLAFGGDLIAKGGGTLTVRDVTGKAYTYYRLVLKETAYTSGRYSLKKTANVELNEFGLYKADGTRLNNYAVASTNNVATLREKQSGLQDAEMFTAGTAGSVVGGKHVGRLSDCNNSSGYVFSGSWRDTTRYITPDDPGSWVKAVVRLGDTETAASFDLNYVSPFTGGAAQPTAFSIDASADGVNWDADLFVTNNIDFQPPSYYFWLSSMTSIYTNNYKITNPERVTHGRIPLTNGVMLATYDLLSHVRSIGAAAGTKLVFDGARKTVAGLRVSAADGLGTIENFALAASGTLYVDGLAGATSLKIPGDLSDVANLENAANWSLNVDGKETSNYAFAVTESGIRIDRKGLFLIIR